MLEAAIDGWPLAKKRGVQMMTYCRKTKAEMGINTSTLKAYLLGQRQLNGIQQRGRPSHLSVDQQQLVADIMASADKGHKGKPRRSAISIVAQLKPEITLMQAASHYDNTLLPKAKKDASTSPPRVKPQSLKMPPREHVHRS